jgi:GalNAc5-diNAcBac-PP-undecaprenol beta-1,3-glucosyltransferase
MLPHRNKPTVSVIVPTHEHGELLGYSVRSALRQTVAELEVVVIGDGVDEVTRAVALELAASDDRVRFFDFPKGPRLGEVHRHRILTSEACGRYVLYLSDDDIWFPEHAEHMIGLLQGADFAHAMAVWLTIDGVVQVTTLDLSMPFHRDAVAAGRQTPGLSTAGHSMAAYRRLPHGWRTTPEGIPTDSWMWRQFLEQPWCTAISGKIPTHIHLPSPPRRAWLLEQRAEELARYDRLSRDERWRRSHCERYVEQLLDESAWFWSQVDHLERWGANLEEQLREVWHDRAEQYAIRERLEAELGATRGRSA